MMLKKNFDFVCSIGEDCACAMYLQDFELRKESIPFDWLTKANFQTRIELIINDFQEFMTKKNFSPLAKPEGMVDAHCDYYQNTKLDFYFYHDFPTGQDFEDSFENVKDKYEKRISRLYEKIEEAQTILFVWWSRDKIIPNDLLCYYYDQLTDKFKNKDINMLIFEANNSVGSDIEYVHVKANNILKVIGDFATYDTSNPSNATQGNKQRSNAIFSLISRLDAEHGNAIKTRKNTPTQKRLFKNMKYILSRLLCMFIFNKDMRRKVRNKLERKKYV